MRTIGPILLLILTLSGLPLLGAADAQDANKLVEQYLKAAGGSQALGKIQSLKIEGTIAGGDGRVGTYTLSVKAPNRYYSELVVGGKSSIEAYNGKSAWRQNAAGEIATLVGPEGARIEAAAQYYNSRLVNAKKSKLSVAFVGHAPVRGKDALQIEVSGATGVKRQVFFDPQSHLIVKESSAAGGVDETLYDDYRAVQGVRFPFRIELHRGNETYPIAVTRAAIGETIAERVFDFPRQSQVQLPDLKALFQEIGQNQKTIDKIKENYAGTRTVEETQYEGNGTVKKREVKEYSFFYLHGQQISTLGKKDGTPLGDPERKKEDERVRKQVQEVQKREAKKDQKAEKAKAEGKDTGDGDAGIETVMRACQFVNPRRERFRGQDVLVFDFEPNPEFKAHKLQERVMQKLAGVVWIDEKAHAVARLEAYFVGDVKLAGGLANVQKGSGFVVEQAFVNNEVWLPTYAEGHVGARLLFKGIRRNDVTRFSDYRKFQVESLFTVGSPKQ
jgi:hypothetical protein